MVHQVDWDAVRWQLPDGVDEGAPCVATSRFIEGEGEGEGGGGRGVEKNRDGRVWAIEWSGNRLQPAVQFSVAGVAASHSVAPADQRPRQRVRTHHPMIHHYRLIAPDWRINNNQTRNNNHLGASQRRLAWPGRREMSVASVSLSSHLLFR